MSEPSSGVPGEIADADVEAPTTDEPTTVELERDEEKLEAWDDVKSDYQVDPGGEPVPNSMDQGSARTADSANDNGDGDGDADDAAHHDAADDDAAQPGDAALPGDAAQPGDAEATEGTAADN